jgi:hypothetical protein
MDGDKFDLRRNEHPTDANGKFVAVVKRKDIPKYPFTVTYFCHAYGVPYCTSNVEKIKEVWHRQCIHLNGCTSTKK